MATEVVMPQMGESIAEGTITRWLVKVGDKVERDKPLFEISTDKVDAEIPSPASGILLEIRNKENETVPVNQVVALIGEAGESGGQSAAAAAAAASKEPEPPPPPPTLEPPAAAPAVPNLLALPAPRPAPAATDEEERLRKFSSPLVRSMAAKEGVNLEEIQGTGAHGRVTKDDFVAHLDQKKSAPAPVPVAPAAAPVPVAPAAQRPVSAGLAGFHVPAYLPGENVEIEPMSKIRQITAAHMIYSKATSAHVSTVFHIDFSKVARARARAKDGFARKEGTKLSYMPFIFKAVATALKAHKTVNAAIDGTNIVYKKDINIGMAVDMPGRGLIVPVIRSADQLSLVGLAKTANDLADRARSKKLKPDETQGGTFTITNPGVFGSLFGTPVINQPQVAILGVGAIEKRPIVVEDEDGNDSIVIKTMSYFAITYDHRLVDGADADRFMIDVKKVLEQDTWTELDAYL
jgi:2-oxoglutarate dehydrogenase E2 component (dihydrolipoamide succinyltransferase)